MLAVAGTIEGFVSTGTGGLSYRLALGSASLIFLLLYLMNGASYLRRSEVPRAAGGRARTTPA